MIYRLVHDGQRVLALFETNPESVTDTIYTLFEGSKVDCDAEIARLGLQFDVAFAGDESGGMNG